MIARQSDSRTYSFKIKKVGKRIKELERLYGIKNGGSGFYGNQHGMNEELSNNFKAPKTQEDLAKEMGFTPQTLHNYKTLADMIPELEDLVDTGIVTKTTALAMMKQLSEEEQKELLDSIDTSKKLSQKDVEMNEIKNFVNEQFGTIRTMVIDGEPWFVGKDVAEALGYTRATKAIQDRVEPYDKDEIPIKDSIGRMQKTPIINESGLYCI